MAKLTFNLCQNLYMYALSSDNHTWHGLLKQDIGCVFYEMFV